MRRFTILGCGSSGGVPRLGGDWGDCDPTNPKNKRRRCALLVEDISSAGTTRFCIDAGPDFRAQMLDAEVADLDALIISHEHADHIHGIDDIRQFVNARVAEEMNIRAQDPGFAPDKSLYRDLVLQKRMDAYAGLSAYDDLLARFGYLFEAAGQGGYPPIMRLHRIQGDFAVHGQGEAINLTPFAVPHGELNAYGFKIGDLVYLPDVFDLTHEARQLIQNCGVWIIDCLQYRAHSTHANYEKTMSWIDELKPKRVILTNLHTPLDYDVLNAQTPDFVEAAFDGLVVEY